MTRRSGTGFVKHARQTPDSVCETTDGITCSGAFGPSIIPTGTHASATSTIDNGGLTIVTGAVTIRIDSLTDDDDQAIAIAESLQRIGD